MKTEILLGDEAVALGALHAGIRGAFAYPGTPATEMQEYLFRMQRKFPDVYVEWSANEKTAFEAGLGMSYIGQRTIVSMKHVGLNVAADPFMNSAITGVNGGLLIMVADDPGMHSSQNEQDTRYFGDFAKIITFEPSNQQEAYDMTLEAFRISEELKLPVLMRLVTRLAHSRSNVKVGEPLNHKPKGLEHDPKKWTLLPGNARIGFKRLIDQQPDLLNYSNDSSYQNINGSSNGKKMGVIASGVGYNYLMENSDVDEDMSVLKIGVYPIPDRLIKDFLKDKNEVLVVEDGYPFIESRIQTYVVNPELNIRGKLSGDLPETGELNPDVVRKALGKEPKGSSLQEAGKLAIPRPPRLCDGCAHIQVFDILDTLRDELDDLVVFSDIGCYTLGALRQPASIDSCVCMGASVGMAKGAANGGLQNSVGIIGDSTFMHSGIHTLLNAAGDNSPFTLVILDNSTTGMTGGQDLPLPGDKIEKLVVALGVPEEHVRIIDPRRNQFEDNQKIIHDEINYRGLSVIIARRECIVQLKAKKKKK